MSSQEEVSRTEMVETGNEPKAALVGEGQRSSFWCLAITFRLLSFGLHLGVFAFLFAISLYSISKLELIHGFSLLLILAFHGQEWPLVFLLDCRNRTLLAPNIFIPPWLRL